MPLFQTMLVVRLMHALLPLGPAHIGRLGVRHDADHLIRHRELGVDGGRKWVDQFGPVVIPQPEHGAAVGAKVPFGGTPFLAGLATVFDGGVFPNNFAK